MAEPATPSTSDQRPFAHALDFAERVFWDLSWVAVATALIVAVCRLIAHDAHMLLIWGNSFSPYLYAPALILLPLAMWQRRWRMASAAVILVVCQAFWVWPDYLPALTGGSGTSTAPRDSLRVFSANLYCQNDRPADILGEIRAADPEIILLQEYSFVWELAVRESDLMTDYPHRLVQIREDSFGIAVFSKRPLLEKAIWMIGKVPMLDVTVQYQGLPVRIVNWHPLPPRSPSYVSVWRAQYDDLLRRLANHSGPLLVVGDFNATQHARYMQKIARTDLHSAHEQVGRGYAVTFPNGTSLAPPIRLDHVLMSRHWECESIVEGIGAGSDHKPLIADLVLAPER